MTIGRLSARSGVSLMAIIFAGAANAQSVSGAEAVALGQVRYAMADIQAGEAMAPVASSGNDADAPPAYADEIVVTANKRNENVDKVGLSIAVLSSKALSERRITTLESIASVVPGLTFSLSATQTPILTLRGVGFNESSLGVYPAVSVYQGTTLSDLSNNIRARLRTLAPKTGDLDLAPGFSDELTRTVARFNGYAASGNDLEFNRGLHRYDRSYDLLFGAPTKSGSQYQNHSPNATMHPLSDTGPYFAFIMAAGALDTNAGPSINENAQILDAYDRPIPGLYGAGNCIASPARDGYYGPGATIAMAMTYGYIAGMHAVKTLAG